MIVKLIRRVGRSALIEWTTDGVSQRGYLPASELRPAGSRHRTGVYEVEHPELAAPYGLPWAELLTLTATPEAIEAELHRAGLWTAEDLRAHHTRALGAMQAVYARDLYTLIEAASHYSRSDPDDRKP